MTEIEQKEFFIRYLDEMATKFENPTNQRQMTVMALG